MQLILKNLIFNYSVMLTFICSLFKTSELLFCPGLDAVVLIEVALVRDEPLSGHRVNRLRVVQIVFFLSSSKL